MGNIRSRLRQITREEIANIAKRSDWYNAANLDLQSLHANEFEIEIDRIVKYPNEHLRDELLLYVFHVDSIGIGFEITFMDAALVEGTFPTSHLWISYGVCKSDSGDTWETALHWPISYRWGGDLMQVEVEPMNSEPEELSALFNPYQHWRMQEAERAFVKLS